MNEAMQAKATAQMPLRAQADPARNAAEPLSLFANYLIHLQTIDGRLGEQLVKFENTLERFHGSVPPLSTARHTAAADGLIEPAPRDKLFDLLTSIDDRIERLAQLVTLTRETI